ncbi:MAG: hypothetical protein E2583_00560 [Comamonas sp.]|nr:hypothetical protein [Comamonas sp.]
MPPPEALRAFPQGDDAIAAGRPLLGISGLGRALICTTLASRSSFSYGELHVPLRQPHQRPMDGC